MRRTSLAVSLVLASALAATAQTRGFVSSSPSPAPSRSTVSRSTSNDAVPPASVTSQTPQRTYRSRRHIHSFGTNNFSPQCNTSGISPLIPSAMGCTDPFFTGGTVNLRPGFNGQYPIYAPYAYPVYVQDQPAPEVSDTDPPAPTIFERRPIVASPRAASAADKPHSLQQSGPSQPEREQVPTILIFRDGHHTEVLNYAIVGQTLYDLGTFVAHKIPLADLNLQATIKANEERGIDFTVPAATKVE